MSTRSWSRLLLLVTVVVVVSACRLRRPRTPPGGPESPGGTATLPPRHGAPDASGVALGALDAGAAKPKSAD